MSLPTLFSHLRQALTDSVPKLKLTVDDWEALRLRLQEPMDYSKPYTIGDWVASSNMEVERVEAILNAPVAMSPLMVSTRFVTLVEALSKNLQTVKLSLKALEVCCDEETEKASSSENTPKSTSEPTIEARLRGPAG